MKQIALTGIKPTGELHLGNYFGAIKPAIEMNETEDFDNYYFIADHHALNSLKDRNEMINYTRQLACGWLACGLDKQNIKFYRQSRIPEVMELCWILMNVTPKGLMDRAHAYKACVQANAELGKDADDGVNMGLYNYPILMAADILLCNAKFVPVGSDQKQHVEMARDIAKYFNKKYGSCLVVPQEKIKENVAVLEGLDGRKMSKSYGNQIPLFCDETKLKKLIMSIKTDSSLPNEPKSTNCTVFNYYKLVASAKETELMAKRFAEGISWAEAKTMLFEAMNNYLKPMREKYNYYMEHYDEVEKILEQSEEKVRKVAKDTLTRVRIAVGLE